MELTVNPNKSFVSMFYYTKDYRPKNCLNIIKTFIMETQNINVVDCLNLGLLHYCCMYRHNSTIIDFLLKQKNININIKDDVGNTPLHYAVKHNKLHYVKKLVKHKNININSKNKVGMSPFYFCTINYYPEMSKFLSSLENIDLISTDCSEVSLLHYGIVYLNEDAVEKILNSVPFIYSIDKYITFLEDIINTTNIINNLKLEQFVENIKEMLTIKKETQIPINPIFF